MPHKTDGENRAENGVIELTEHQLDAVSGGSLSNAVSGVIKAGGAGSVNEQTRIPYWPFNW